MFYEMKDSLHNKSFLLFFLGEYDGIMADQRNRIRLPRDTVLKRICEPHLSFTRRTRGVRSRLLFHCPFCDYKSTRRYNMNGHLGRKHADKKFRF